LRNAKGPLQSERLSGRSGGFTPFKPDKLESRLTPIKRVPVAD
jgi:hypothetical protein